MLRFFVTVIFSGVSCLLLMLNYCFSGSVFGISIFSLHARYFCANAELLHVADLYSCCFL